MFLINLFFFERFASLCYDRKHSRRVSLLIFCVVHFTHNIYLLIVMFKLYLWNHSTSLRLE